MRARSLQLLFCFMTPVLVCARVGPAPAQQAAPAAAPGAAAAAKSPEPADPQPESYFYDPGGRRDPFVSLLGTGNQPHVTPARGEGKSGLAVAEVSVRGVMQSRGGFVAIVQGPDGRTFLIHQGDKFSDGVVKAVTAEGLVVVQDVNDPESLVKQREVSRKLRSLEVKQ